MLSMTPTEAAQILQALARGIDPETGEVFLEDSPLNSTHVVRALFMGANALSDATSAAKPKRDLPEGLAHAWQAWTREEEDRLVAAFEAGATVEELASTQKRKVGGVTARLQKLGRLEQGATRGDA
jgi:hypothetical protein